MGDAANFATDDTVLKPAVCQRLSDMAEYYERKTEEFCALPVETKRKVLDDGISYRHYAWFTTSLATVLSCPNFFVSTSAVWYRELDLVASTLPRMQHLIHSVVTGCYRATRSGWFERHVPMLNLIGRGKYEANPWARCLFAQMYNYTDLYPFAWSFRRFVDVEMELMAPGVRPAQTVSQLWTELWRDLFAPCLCVMPNETSDKMLFCDAVEHIRTAHRIAACSGDTVCSADLARLLLYCMARDARAHFVAQGVALFEFVRDAVGYDVNAEAMPPHDVLAKITRSSSYMPVSRALDDKKERAPICMMRIVVRAFAESNVAFLRTLYARFGRALAPDIANLTSRFESPLAVRLSALHVLHTRGDDPWSSVRVKACSPDFLRGWHASTSTEEVAALRDMWCFLTDEAGLDAVQLRADFERAVHVLMREGLEEWRPYFRNQAWCLFGAAFGMLREVVLVAGGSVHEATDCLRGRVTALASSLPTANRVAELKHVCEVVRLPAPHASFHALWNRVDAAPPMTLAEFHKEKARAWRRSRDQAVI